ncbi:hypothetical protein PUN28_005071 [Cardiocondyla obscurior]|uniref:Secreted protein n=1 Tax=Cardiocondyla obscurior TaxID=286306 RepID=A0AAW2GGT7_9HYME
MSECALILSGAVCANDARYVTTECEYFIYRRQLAASIPNYVSRFHVPISTTVLYLYVYRIFCHVCSLAYCGYSHAREFFI